MHRLEHRLFCLAAFVAGYTVAAANAQHTSTVAMPRSLAQWSSFWALDEADFLPARAIPTADDVEPVNLRYRLGYRRGFYGAGYVFPRTYAWRLGYWDGYYSFPSYASYWVRYPTCYYQPVVVPRYYYTAPACYYVAPIVYDPCTISIRMTTSGDVLPASSSVSEPLPSSERATPTPAQPNRVSPPLGPQPGEPAPKPSKPSVDNPPNELRLVRHEIPAKRFRYPAYGEHLRSGEQQTKILTRSDR